MIIAKPRGGTVSVIDVSVVLTFNGIGNAPPLYVTVLNAAFIGVAVFTISYTPDVSLAASVVPTMSSVSLPESVNAPFTTSFETPVLSAAILRTPSFLPYPQLLVTAECVVKTQPFAH